MTIDDANTQLCVVVTRPARIAALRNLAAAALREARKLEAIDGSRAYLLQGDLIAAGTLVRIVTDEVVLSAPSDSLYNSLRNAAHCIDRAVELL